jgi:asparagine synthase (glutamine-hydrolysing)
MCGIAGLFDTSGKRELSPRQLEAMTTSLAHRGPDGAGYHRAPGIALGHRRLAIIDVARGHQPLFNEDGTVAITYNGEIYNYQELIAELTSLGHTFATQSDTEVVVHAWEEWGAQCVRRFRGMFAFALWDERRETLFLARDRLGKKPLFYALLDNGVLAFASELKALIALPELSREIDPTAIEDYFAYGYVPETKSIYASVKKLLPAHILTMRRGSSLPDQLPYWDVSFAPQATGDDAELEADLVTRLDEAVRIRLISEVPLGAFLSGGVDSSAVVALMAGASSEAVRSFSIGFTQASHDESAYARWVADRYETNHYARIVDADDFALVDRLPQIYDEPFADSSAIPTYRVSALARERVTVALSGDGGDEVFAGYRRYQFHQREERLRHLMPGGLRRAVFGVLGAIYPQLDRMPRYLRARSTFQELAVDTVEGFFRNVSSVGDEIRRRLFTSELRRELQGYHAKEQLARYFDTADTEDPLARAQYVDLKTWLPGDILAKVDRASMACSLETRAPLLDHELIEWAATLPATAKLRDGVGKRILKRAFAGRLSDEILYRPKKGFSVPLAEWFRGPLRSRLRAALTSARLHQTGWFDAAYIATLLDQHQSGSRDHSTVLWSLLMFDGFLRDVHEAPTVAAPEARLTAVTA